MSLTVLKYILLLYKQCTASSDEALCRSLIRTGLLLREVRLEGSIISNWLIRDSSLIRRLSDRRPFVRVAACNALGEARSYNAVLALMPLLEDPETVVAVSVINALAGLNHRDAGQQLARLLDTCNDTVGVAILKALQQFRDDSTIDQLWRCFHRRPAFRVQTAVVLAHLGQSEAHAFLVKHMCESLSQTHNRISLAFLLDQSMSEVYEVLLKLGDTHRGSQLLFKLGPLLTECKFPPVVLDELHGDLHFLLLHPCSPDQLTATCRNIFDQAIRRNQNMDPALYEVLDPMSFPLLLMSRSGLDDGFLLALHGLTRKCHLSAEEFSSIIASYEWIYRLTKAKSIGARRTPGVRF